jgi:hypothetical protein
VQNVAGSLIAKKMGLKIESTKADGGKRRYHIA